jgi:hypothetical protein
VNKAKRPMGGESLHFSFLLCSSREGFDRSDARAQMFFERVEVGIGFVQVGNGLLDPHLGGNS